MMTNSNKDLGEYLKNLSQEHFCKYSEPLASIVLFCNFHLNCTFQSKIALKHRGNDKFECNRQKFMRLKKIL